MTDLRTAAQQALEALSLALTDVDWRAKSPTQPVIHRAYAALRAALAQQEQAPVAHLWQHSETGRTRIVMPDQVVTMDATWFVVGPLYLHPPRREWVSLTDEGLAELARQEELLLICDDFDALREIARAIEAKLKEKNT